MITKETAKERLEGLDQYLEEVIDKRRVPALGISIVLDDDIIYAKGFGTTKLKSQQKTTENTIRNIEKFIHMSDGSAFSSSGS